MTRILRRLRAACKTNEPQASACLCFMLMTVAVLCGHGAPWWGALSFALVWPALAFVFNLIDPIP